jgi:hypothetical protein
MVFGESKAEAAQEAAFQILFQLLRGFTRTTAAWWAAPMLLHQPAATSTVWRMIGGR